MPDRGSPVLIYGAGNRGRQVAAVLGNDGYDIVGFMDRGGGAGATVNGLPCHAVANAQTLGFASQPPSVVVAIFRHDIDLSNLYAELPVLGFPKVTAFYELVEHYPGTFHETWWQGSRARLTEWHKQLEQTFSLLADAQSRDIFLECLRLRTGDVSALCTPDREHQYFPAGVLPEGGAFRFVDCGAYDGDTWRNLRAHSVDVRAMAAFEPDAENFARLATQFHTAETDPSEVVLLPCAVWSETTTLRFSAGGAHNSHIDPCASGAVQAVALDDVLAGFHPNWIKMDVEGAEIEALSGARRIIERHRPFLAVATYHQADHLWRLPELIRRWDLGYRFYLRYHGYAGVDTVLYARAD